MNTEPNGSKILVLHPAVLTDGRVYQSCHVWDTKRKCIVYPITGLKHRALEWLNQYEMEV